MFSVSTDYLLGLDRSAVVDVTGLDEREIALLSELADMLRHRKK